MNQRLLNEFINYYTAHNKPMYNINTLVNEINEYLNDNYCEDVDTNITCSTVLNHIHSKLLQYYSTIHESNVTHTSTNVSLVLSYMDCQLWQLQQPIH